MKAYFIGGSADLTCRQMPDEPLREIEQPRAKPMPIVLNRGMASVAVAQMITERYRRYDLPDQYGRLIAVYVFQGDDEH